MVQALSSRTIRIGLVACGGHGSGATDEALPADDGTRLVGDVTTPSAASFSSFRRPSILESRHAAGVFPLSFSSLFDEDLITARKDPWGAQSKTDGQLRSTIRQRRQILARVY
jgi:hypothetical protein